VPLFGGAFQQRLQVTGQPGVCRNPQVRQRLDLLRLTANATRNDGASHRPRAFLEHHPGRCQMVAETVQNEIVGTEPGGAECRRPAPRVWFIRLRVVDRTRRLEDPSQRRKRHGEHAAQPWTLTLNLHQLLFAQHGQSGKIGGGLNIVRRQTGCVHASPKCGGVVVSVGDDLAHLRVEAGVECLEINHCCVHAL